VSLGEQALKHPLQLSVVIPAHNEAPNLKWLIPSLIGALRQSNITHEVLVVNDHSNDNTSSLLKELSGHLEGIRVVQRTGQSGFGRTMRDGLESAQGDVIIPFMGDASDDPLDVPRLYHKVMEGYDVVYGSRFSKGGHVKGYPFLKLIANRLGNTLVRWVYRIPEKDITNAFKAFRRDALRSLFPIEATEFNITLELAIKAHLKGCRYTSIPVRWEGRKSGVSNFNFRDLTRYYRDYLFTLLVMLGHSIKQGSTRSDRDAGGLS